MQINGLREFASNFMPSLQNIASQNHASPLASVFPQQNTDIINLSEIGKRLSFRIGENSLVSPSANTRNDPMLQLMDESMTKVESILNEMKELAKLAAEPNVTIADRLKLQIEMEDLRYTLDKALHSMSRRLSQEQEISNGGPWISIEDQYGNRHMGFLKRALARALNGEAWDVGETSEITKAARLIFAGDEVIEVGKWGDGGKEWFDFELPPGVNPEDVTVLGEMIGRRVVPTDDKNAPTVRQILESSGTIILLDVESAKNGIERIEKEIEAIREMREIFNAFSKQNSSTISRNNRNVDGVEGLHTELGVMQSVNGTMRLVIPTNAKGEMFAKIERLFHRMSGDFVVSTVDTDTNSTPPERKIVWSNWNPPTAA